MEVKKKEEDRKQTEEALSKHYKDTQLQKNQSQGSKEPEHQTEHLRRKMWSNIKKER